MNIGERLRALRKEAGLTQKELGERLGVSASMIGQYETNLRKPKYETLERIASVLDVSISEFIDLSDFSPSLNSLPPLIDSFKSILNKPHDSSGAIHLSLNERDQIRQLGTLLKKIPIEMESSALFQKMVKDSYFSLYDKLNFPGKCIAVEMLTELSKDRNYKAE